MAVLDAINEHAAVVDARGLQPLLRAKRAEADAGARMAPDVLKAMGEAGMFRLAAPVEVGGLEVRLAVMAATLEELAVGDPGAAWHLANSPVAGLVAAYLDESARETLFADPSACYSYSAMPSARAQPVEGGYRLTGRWPFVTGVRDAEWAVLSAMIQTDGEPVSQQDLRKLRLFVVPTSLLEVEDTWSKAAAMRSSGSHAARVQDAFIEERFVYSYRQPRLLDRTLYRMTPALVFHACASAIAVGVLRGAVEASIDAASKKRSSFDETAWSDLPRVRRTIARAATTHYTLRSGLLTILDQLEDSYGKDAPPPIQERAIAWGMMYHVADEARNAIGSLAGPASSQAFISGHPYEIAVRDIHAILVAGDVP